MSNSKGSTMGETSKQVRVDNWGIFFLSRLQVFFNKTDYCDLTLQFEGNVQLKVHRLVMNACTEYFQMLEQSCEVVDDILLMPPTLQADVILPIVNFMYTGMLEFQMSLFDKLYKTAELMNITVLLKLLDAQKQPHQQVPKSVVSKVPPTYNLQGKKIAPKVDKILPPTLPGRKLPVWKRRTAPVPVVVNQTSTSYTEARRTGTLDPLASYDNSPKPTRFEWPEEDLKNFSMMENSFDAISYSSKPLLTQEDELKASTSFDELRHSQNSIKRTKEYNNQSVDMEELKDYVKEQKIRSDFVELEEDVDNDLVSDPDYHPEGMSKRKQMSQVSSTTKRVRFMNEKENKETKINITPVGKGEVDHSKIISEVLKKYPHLVKKNKNIRLKILAKNKSLPPVEKKVATPIKVKTSVKQVVKTTQVYSKSDNKNLAEGPWVCEKCTADGEQTEFVLYYLYRKHMTDVHNEKCDSRMCKYCGHKSAKHNMLMYHQYTKHGIKPPAAYNFPKCNQCPYIALNDNLLIKHKLTHTKFDSQCVECKVGFNSETSLRHHVQITGHTGKTGRSNYDCQYCTKHYHTGASLFSHIRMQHRDEARRDGIVSIDESDEYDEDDDPKSSDEKIKILSDYKLAEQIEAPINNIATNLGLVDIVVLDENQQYILHSNDQSLVAAQQELTTNQEFILPDISNTFVQNQGINQVITTSEHNVIAQSMLGNSDIASTDELVMVLTDHDYNEGNSEIDNSNIVVLYSHPVEGQENQFITSQGNIMLNSETGMLEIRNQDTIMETNTVESIEMIQREIDSHSVVKQVTENQQIQLIEDQQIPTVETGARKDGIEETGIKQSTISECAEPMEVDDDFNSAENTKESVLMGTTGSTLKQLPEDKKLPTLTEIPVEVVQDEGPDEATDVENEKHKEQLVEETNPIAQIEHPEEEEKTVEKQTSQDSEDFEPEPMEVDGKKILNTEEEKSEQVITDQGSRKEQEIGEAIKAIEVDEIIEENVPDANVENAKDKDGDEEMVQPKEVSIDTTNKDVEISIDVGKIEEPKVMTSDELDKNENSELKVTKADSPNNESNTEVMKTIDQNEDNEREKSENDAHEDKNEGEKVNVTPGGDTEDGEGLESGGDQESNKRAKAAKISILDDWEDTDSQQSEHGKSANTVNKLMNDWDDD